MKRADIAINTVIVIFIAIVSIFLLLGLFGTKLPVFAKKLYCNTFFFIHKATFIPEGVRADQNYCKEGERGGDLVILQDENLLKKEILSYIIACWDKAEEGKYTKNLRCYELSLGRKIQNSSVITEADITELLVNSNLCEYLPNNDADPACGKENHIEWDVPNDEFVPNHNVLVEYLENESIILVS